MERRFIPACAGNSLAACRLAPNPPVHPRVCGEQIAICVGNPFQTGSSPRVRGTGVSETRRQGSGRFIPACAGNREGTQPMTLRQPVHPRVCGEQMDWARSCVSRVGSSPRVRGTVVAVLAQDAQQRFIPACAGNRC